MKYRGFTLTEIMLIISIIVIVGAITAPLGFSYYQLTEVDAFTDEFVANLKTAREMAMSSRADDNYGLAVNENSYVVFKGNYFNGVVSSGDNDGFDDQEILITPDIALTGPSQLFFSKVTGTSSLEASYQITSGDYKNYVNVDAQGNIQKK